MQAIQKYQIYLYTSKFIDVCICYTVIYDFMLLDYYAFKVRHVVK